MRFLFLVLSVTTVASATELCSPGTYFKTYCNTCVCAKDGSASICTQKLCPPGLFNSDGSLKVPLDIIQEIIPDVTEIEIFESQLIAAGDITYVQVCTPNSFFYKNCNRCQCSKHGTQYDCEKNDCRIQPHFLTPQSTSYRVARSVCEPNKVFTKDCNICACNNDSTAVACTLIKCNTNVSNKNRTSIKSHHRVTRSNKKQVCQPGTLYNNYCNKCICSEDGTYGACTKRNCDKTVFNQDGTLKTPYNCIKSGCSDKKKICEPGTLYKDYCNTCICSENGTFGACTKRNCDKTVFNKDGTLKTPHNPNKPAHSGKKQVCEPGTLYNDYCNKCICSEDGTFGACTKRNCDKTVFNQDGTLKARNDLIRQARAVSTYQHLNCEPGKLFNQYCNQCICSGEGSDYACTRKLCDKDVFNKNGTLKTSFYCEPNSHFKDFCNICQCSADGLNATCTTKACNPAIYNEDGSLKNPVKARLLLSNEEVKQNWGPLYLFGDPCEPGKSFYSECNQCVCLNNGKSAYCTMKMCYKFEMAK